MIAHGEQMSTKQILTIFAIPLYCGYMASINISLPESLLAFLKDQVKKRGYSTASEYMRDLLRAAAERKASAHLEKLLLEGLESGEGRIVDDAFWKEFQRKTEAHRSSKK